MTHIPCPECDGSGSVRAIIGDEQTTDRCPSCGGSGLVQLREPIVEDEHDVFGSETVAPSDVAEAA